MRVPRSRQGVLENFFLQTAIFSPRQGNAGVRCFYSPPEAESGVAAAVRLQWSRSFWSSWGRRKGDFSRLGAGRICRVSAIPLDEEGVHRCEGSLQPTSGCPACATRQPAALGDGSPPPPPPSVALQASILVLNRLYMAVHVIGVRRAFALLCRELAEVIHHEDGVFANYTFESWRQWCSLRASGKRPHEDWIRAVNFEIQVPRSHSPLDLRPPPQAEPAPESPQRAGPRRPFVPVLRPALPHPSTEPRPRAPAEPRGNDHLGKHRLRLPGVQCA